MSQSEPTPEAPDNAATRFEQAAHDHRIGDIGDLHLIQTKKLQAFGKIKRNRFDRIVHTCLPRFVKCCVNFFVCR